MHGQLGSFETETESTDIKDAGAAAIVAVNAVGGITAPAGALVLPEQIIDYTWGRDSTLFDDPNDPLVHVDFSWPFDPVLRRRLRGALERAGLQWVDGGCYAATQGPRLETAAEILRLERDGCDIVGMTGILSRCVVRNLRKAATKEKAPRITAEPFQQSLRFQVRKEIRG